MTLMYSHQNSQYQNENYTLDISAIRDEMSPSPSLNVKLKYYKNIFHTIYFYHRIVIKLILAIDLNVRFAAFRY